MSEALAFGHGAILAHRLPGKTSVYVYENDFSMGAVLVTFPGLELEP